MENKEIVQEVLEEETIIFNNKETKKLTKELMEKVLKIKDKDTRNWHKSFRGMNLKYGRAIRDNTDLKIRFENILNDIEKIQKFIEEENSVNSQGRNINDFQKLCFINEDLTELSKKVCNIGDKQNG